MLIHVVSAGETLWQIANRYAVPVQSISQLIGTTLSTKSSRAPGTVTPIIKPSAASFSNHSCTRSICYLLSCPKKGCFWCRLT